MTKKGDLAQISECLLDFSFEEILEDEATMFGFEKLYYAIADGDLRFEETGRLRDEQLIKGTWDDKDAIRERLELNSKLSDKLDFITHHFPNELEDKLAAEDLGEKFVKEHFPKDDVERYKTTLDLGECLAEQDKNRTELLELESIKAPHLEYVTKTKTESGAGLRENHILLFLEADQHAFELDLSFIKQKLKDSYCSVQHDNYEQKAVVTIKNLGGVRSRAIVTGSFNGQARYIAVQVKTDKPKETHKFKILVLRKNDFFEEGFKHNFLVEPDKKKQYITLQTDDNSLQIAEEGNAATVQRNEECLNNQEFATVDFKKLASESDEVCFTVEGKETKLTFNVEGEVSTDSLSLPLLLDQGRFNHIFEDDYYGQFNRSKNKVQIDGKEIAPKAKRLTLLQYEAQLVDKSTLSKQTNGQTLLHDIEGVYNELFLAYRDLFDYLHKTKTLISLAGWGAELRQIITKIVAAYQQEINQIPFNAPLSKAQKTLVNIGFAEFSEQEYITPLHPLVLAYNANLASVLAEDKKNIGSFKKLPPVTINRLTVQGLMPFVYDAKNDFSYNHSEKENVFWSKLIPQQESSYDFVRSLVKDKVNKFTAAFKHLFVAGNKTTLIINSVNNQQNKEVFLGLIDYIKLKKDKVTNIHVNLYDEAESYCWFDKFADTASYDELKDLCELNKGSAKTQADSIIDLLRTRLTYSKFTHDKGEKAQAYAHMSFFKNNERVQATDVDVLKQKTGVACHGLMPGEAATNKNGRYYTAFGLHGIDTSEAPQLELVAKYSGLVKPARSQHEEYNPSRSQALVVTEEFKTLLERSYENSIWTTIIDPKVTLEFFENQKEHGAYSLLRQLHKLSELRRDHRN
ncbi:DNA phosphorothioation-dependent restriction protein DptH [Pseudoalteromonas luteoviolacea]|uniref:DNA phosphorothioation-dependent restriction protein DptH n=1 Tax=Pseudoalteromonas luteoviolacea TaxID=43657 RepID=UPI000A885C17